MAQPNMRSMRKTDFEKQVFLAAHPVGHYVYTENEDESTPAKMKNKYGGTWEQIIDESLVGAGNKFEVGVSYGKSDSMLPYHNHTTNSQNASTTSSDTHTHTATFKYYSQGGTGGSYPRPNSSGSETSTGVVSIANDSHSHTYSHTHATTYAGTNETLVDRNYHPVRAVYCYLRIE